MDATSTMTSFEKYPGRPSFFEVYAAQHLNGTFRPAVRFVLDVLAVRHRRLRFLANWSDEFFSLIMLLLGCVQLRRYSCLLSESFFGLRRTTTSDFAPLTPQQDRLSPTQISLALLFDVVFSYARTKADAAHSRLTGGAAAPLFEDDQAVNNNDSSAPPSIFSITRRQTFVSLINQLVVRIRYLRRDDVIYLFVKWYPKLRSALDGANVLLSLLYLYGHSRFFSLSLLLQRLSLRRDSQVDSLNLSFPSHFRSSSLRYNTLTSLADGLFNTLKTAFIASVFAFRFLQYYYTTESSVPRETGPAILPPERLHPAHGVNEQAAFSSGRCPLCHQARVSSTACSTSGYVFCYICIVAHVQQEGKCPVTLAPTSVDDLVRVYEEDSST